MAYQTITLGELIQDYGYTPPLNTYPIYDEQHRDGLNSLIVNHFWYRDIALETPAMFGKFLERKMMEIMPYYNQMYKSIPLPPDNSNMWNMWGESDSSTTHDGTSDDGDETSTVTSDSESTNLAAPRTSDSKGRVLTSDTPQTQLSGSEDYASALTDSVNQATTTQSAPDESNTSSTATTNTHHDPNTEHYTDESHSEYKQSAGLTMTGYMLEYRQSILNVDMMVIDELDSLFSQIWSIDAPMRGMYGQRGISYGY